jgi:hypothetical protein
VTHTHQNRKVVQGSNLYQRLTRRHWARMRKLDRTSLIHPVSQLSQLEINMTKSLNYSHSAGNIKSRSLPPPPYYRVSITCLKKTADYRTYVRSNTHTLFSEQNQPLYNSQIYGVYTNSILRSPVTGAPSCLWLHRFLFQAHNVKFYEKKYFLRIKVENWKWWRLLLTPVSRLRHRLSWLRYFVVLFRPSSHVPRIMLLVCPRFVTEHHPVTRR